MQNDLEKAVNFYKDILELPCLFYIKNQWAEFQLNSIKIGLCPVEENSQIPKHTGIVIEVENIESTYNSLIGKNVVFEGEPLKMSHGIVATFSDTSGNKIDIYQPTHELIRDAIKKQSAGCCKPTLSKCCK